MNQYVYRWHIEPEPSLRIDVEVAASNVITARRTVIGFLREHGGAKWTIESVSRRVALPSEANGSVSARGEVPAAR